MKLRLPLQLLRAVILVLGSSTVHAALMHQDVSLRTYVDFASNAGRYAAGTTNELLDYIRERDKGVKIEYTSGADAQLLPHGMISFDSVADMGNGTLTNHNYLVTVKHNATLDPTFGANKYGVGKGNAIVYKGIEEEGANNTFVLDASTADYKLIRLSKLVTDAQSATLYNPPIIAGKTDMTGQLVYRVGGGTHQVCDYAGNRTLVSEGGDFNLGGVGSISHWEDKNPSWSDEDYKYAQIKGKESWAQNGFSKETPLPFGSQGGDSGSPYFAWNESSSQFELLLAHTGSFSSGELPDADALPWWSQNTMEQYNVRINMKDAGGTVGINGVNGPDDDKGTPAEDVISDMEVSVMPSYGYLSKAGGTPLTSSNGDAMRYIGVASGTNTWKSLFDLRNTSNWYAYDNTYLNATQSVVPIDKEENQLADGLTYAMLYQTQNLVFEAQEDNAEYHIKVAQDTDLGVGYLHFVAEKLSGVQFYVEPAGSNQLNSAGYVVDAGVQVNVSLCNADIDYMREWRKVGEGTLNICGSIDNNEIFLNVGGAGETLLNQQNGYYAAYNVLVNTGATVVIKDKNQIFRDLTFGNGGGVLDMNGNSMDWYTTNGEDHGDGFTINALTEEAVITNEGTDTSTLTYLQGGESNRFVGSFRDTANGALSIVYDAKGTWELNSIRTCLAHKDSGLTVASGTVKLAGTKTVHGLGMATDNEGKADFSTRENDWHYADATMNVTVKEGATFELESHARLIGSVTVESGGEYIMHEGVQHEKEYIEGGEKQEFTAKISAYYGHKGDVKLEENASLLWKRGSTEVASLTGKNNGGILANVESAIASETSLRLAAAKDKVARVAAAVMSLKDGVRLELADVIVEASSSITTEGKAAVSMQNATLALSDTNTELLQSRSSSALTLKQCGDPENIMVLDGSEPVLTMKSDILSGALSISGSSLTVDFRGMDSMPGSGVVQLVFGPEVSLANPYELRVTALTDSGQLTGYYNPEDVSCMYFSIPEPATATLSLLALATLTLRRRRSM